MKKNIIIGLLAIGVGLYCFSEYQKYAEKQRWIAWAAEQQRKEQASHNEFIEMICKDIQHQMDLYRQDSSMYVEPSSQRQVQCKGWFK